MEIRYLDRKEHERSRALYEEVFVEDEQAFVDAYYQIKAADNQILVAEEDGQIVSMLHAEPLYFLLPGRDCAGGLSGGCGDEGLLPAQRTDARAADKGSSGYGGAGAAFYLSDACGRGDLHAL